MICVVGEADLFSFGLAFGLEHLSELNRFRCENGGDFLSTRVHEDVCAARPQVTLDCRCLQWWAPNRKPSCLVSNRIVSKSLVPNRFALGRLVLNCPCEVYEAANTSRSMK